MNDAPVPGNDPPSTGLLAGLTGPGMTLRDVIAGAKVLYSIPAADPSKATVTVSAGGSTFVLSNLCRTDEDTALSLPAAFLLGNDTDVDQDGTGPDDVLSLTLGAGQNVSREGASVQLIGYELSTTY